jgi:hypothetical protein
MFSGLRARERQRPPRFLLRRGYEQKSAVMNSDKTVGGRMSEGNYQSS